MFHPNFFTDPRDVDALVQGIRESIKIVQQPEFQKLGAKLYNVSIPGCEHVEMHSDEYWRCYIQHLSVPLHHQTGTCKMGAMSDATAVVNAHGIVHGLSNLRVADISILPEPLSGHAAAASFLIGEKISDSILNSWQPKGTNIQKLLRVRKGIDWLYQDPNHAVIVQENSTNPSSHPTTTHRPQQTTKQHAPSIEIMHVLHALNMSAINEQSQQFKDSAIGDVGIILWGSSSATRTIDFKLKLAEHANSTAVKEAKLNEHKPRIIKRVHKANNTVSRIEMTTEIGVDQNITSLTDAAQTTEPAETSPATNSMVLATESTAFEMNSTQESTTTKEEAEKNLDQPFPATEVSKAHI